jgi:hypothetical protein
MNPHERLNLEKMIVENNVEDCTQDIRNKKHSDLIKNDVNTMIELKKKYERLIKSNPAQFESMCISKCNFLFNNYTDLFNKVKKDELDLRILSIFLATLKEIEDNKLDQHEGAHKIGNILKQLYIDSALKKSDQIEKGFKNKHKGKKEKLGKKMSWMDYKKMHVDD